ncbi:extensin family protein [Pontivivens nitratireducens]|uniref:extensin-like domain-containing protein n=1 Tax=Pontivivens nitratireducens TaxID=2758038 RepID=UPI00163AD647|nr:extensin family protein [Pontibrevibacter nitratireducens]
MRRLICVVMLALTACGSGDKRRAGAVDGALCGDPRLQGEALPPVIDGGACAIAAAVRVSAIGTVAIGGAPVMDCRTALAFADWTAGGLSRAARKGGRKVSRVDTVASYACRNRYGRAGGRISNHALGRAVDVSAVGFTDGSRLSVLHDWTDTTILQEAAGHACGPFDTVLGPNYNAAHRDHLHLDVTDEYGGATFCR